jgi:hypothetical protein
MGYFRYALLFCARERAFFRASVRPLYTEEDVLTNSIRLAIVGTASEACKLLKINWLYFLGLYSRPCDYLFG